MCFLMIPSVFLFYGWRLSYRATGLMSFVAKQHKAIKPNRRDNLCTESLPRTRQNKLVIIAILPDQRESRRHSAKLFWLYRYFIARCQFLASVFADPKMEVDTGKAGSETIASTIL